MIDMLSIVIAVLMIELMNVSIRLGYSAERFMSDCHK